MDGMIEHEGMEELFRALADSTRLRLLNLMRDQEVCVCFLVEIIGTNQPKISRHLASLRKAGLVHPRREGKWMHYSLRKPTNPNAARMMDDLLQWMERTPDMKAEREKLVQVCCATDLPVQLQGAPIPKDVRTTSISEA